MKLRPITKLDKGKTTPSKKQKKITMALCQQNTKPSSFFQFMVDLEPSGTWILDIWSSTFAFPLILTFYFTKTENRTKKSLIQLSSIALIKGTFFAKNCCFFSKKVMTSEQLRGSWYHIFSN